MAKREKTTSKPKEAAYADPAPEENGGHSYCSLPQVPERVFGPDVDPRRASLIAYMAKKWVNGTVLHYYFFDEETDGETVFLSDGTAEWRGKQRQHPLQVDQRPRIRFAHPPLLSQSLRSDGGDDVVIRSQR